MNWEEYEKKLNNKAVHSIYSFSFGNVIYDDIMPPFAKASAYLLKDLIKGGAKRLVVVIPENQELVATIFLEKLLSDILDGTIKNEYDLSKFSIGEKVAIGNAIVEYHGTEYDSAQNEVLINFCLIGKKVPMKVKMPLSKIPFMQHANTNKKLSNNDFFMEEIRRMATAIKNNSNKPFGKIALSKTHLSGSALLVSPQKRVRDLITTCSVKDNPLTDLVDVGQVDFEGRKKSIGPAQLSGNPGALLASDLYSAAAASEKGVQIESVSVVVDRIAQILKELDSLDELLELDVPVIVFVDSVSSIELDELKKRDFFIWRWDKNWLSSEMIGRYDTTYAVSANNLQKRDISYIEISEEVVSETFNLINRYKADALTQTASVNTVFDKLLDLAFQTVRTVLPKDEVEKEAIRAELDQLRIELDSICKALPDNEYKDFRRAISNFKKIYGPNSILPKVKMIEEQLALNKYPKSVFAFPSSVDIESFKAFWQSWIKEQAIETTIDVYSFSDYYSLSPMKDSQTVVCGWYNEGRMCRLLFQNQTPDYSVILYGCESLWKGHKPEKWELGICKNDNALLCSDYLHLDVEPDVTFESVLEHPVIDEYEDVDELEKYVNTIKYRKYLHAAGTRETDVLTVIPVFFSNGTFMFMRLGQEVVSISKMLLEDWDDIERKDSLELVVGDYIVFRESGKDLIKEVADSLLEKGGQIDARQVASKWRQALDLELMFSSEDEIYQKMKRQGWAKTKDTLQRWIMDKTLIAPQTRRDIEILVEATDNAVTGEMIDEIYNSSRVVKNAHINAGKLLSSRLKKELGHYVKEMAVDMDSHKDSIDIMIEDVGTIKILRITNIGEQAQVNNSYVGRLMQD